jgi:ppGpp synthetase/RelA/SpoT-type nucleotidyltranferase
MANRKTFPHWGSKGAINRAGDAIRHNTITPGQALALESWRMAHRDVIHAFEALLRARAKNHPDMQVAQRLKRRRTIMDKLSRFSRMELARMDDVAGCRLIFPSIEALHTFRGKVHRAKFKHVLRNEKNKYDYIERPTDRGYRGIHDIYEYRARKGKSTKCDGLLIEIQYRTKVQHAWATAVEVVTQMTENEPKFDRGDRRHIKLFCLASEMLARAHEATSRMPEVSNLDLVKEFGKLNAEIGVMESLINLSIHEWIGNQMESDHIILQVTKDKEFKLHQFDLELEASKRLLELEKEFPEDDIVLVGARNVEEVTSAFRNYFNDVREFMRLMFAADKFLDPKRETVELSAIAEKAMEHQK